MHRIQFLVLIALVALAGPVWGQKDEGKTNQSGPEVSNAATTDPAYVIGAQDVLDISVWKEKELTETVPVRPDGRFHYHC